MSEILDVTRTEDISKGKVIAYIQDHLGVNPITSDEMHKRKSGKATHWKEVRYFLDLSYLHRDTWGIKIRRTKEACVHCCKWQLVEDESDLDSKDYAFFIKFPFDLAAHCKGTVPYPKEEEHIYRKEEISE